jgi:tetratricopeptide (TPR) repeat protein
MAASYRHTLKYCIKRRLSIAVIGLVFGFALTALASCASNPPQTHAKKTPVEKSIQIPINPSDKKKYDEVRQHLLNKEFPMAEAKLQAIIANYPNHSGAWANLGVIYSETNRLELAEKALKKSIALNSNSAQIYLRLGLVYKKQGKLVEALKMYKQSIEIDANNAKAHYNMAILYDLYMQDRPAAITHLKKYVSISGKKDDETIAWIKQLERDNARKQTAEN